MQGIYGWKDAKEARTQILNWCAWVREMWERTGEAFEPMTRTARMIDEHLEVILAYWPKVLTTAFIKGLNSLFSDVKRRARDYRTVEYMTTVLYFVAGKLTLACH